VWTSYILFYLSVVISVVIGLFVTGVFVLVFLKDRVCTSMLGLLVTHRRTFGHIKKTLKQSMYFAVEEPIPDDKLASTHGLLTQHVDLTKLSVLYFKVSSKRHSLSLTDVQGTETVVLTTFCVQPSGVFTCILVVSRHMANLERYQERLGSCCTRSNSPRLCFTYFH